MFSERLKWLRKEKGISQQELADKLCVVRQTISKWEKGLSLPDAEMLMKLAEVLGVTVNELLGIHTEDNKAQQEIIEQLMKINEQLVIKNRRSRKIWKIIGIILAVFILGNLLLIVLSVLLFSANKMTIGTGGAEEVFEVEVIPEEQMMNPPALILRDSLSSTLSRCEVSEYEYNWAYRGNGAYVNMKSNPPESFLSNQELMDLVEVNEYEGLDTTTYSIGFADAQHPDEITVSSWDISALGNENAESELHLQESRDMMVELEKGKIYELKAVWKESSSRDYYGTVSYVFYTE